MQYGLAFWITAQQDGRCKSTDLLDFVGVQVEDVLVLEANEIEGGGGTPPHDARALRPRQHLLQLHAVPRIYLRPKSSMLEAQLCQT